MRGRLWLWSREERFLIALGHHRTLIKKASYLTIEEDGTVIVSDKNGDVFA
jgi:hypothetical protein